MILVDTSLWVDYLRGTPAPSVDALTERLDRNEVLMCGPVAAELLAGRDARGRMQLWETVSAMPWADLGRVDYFIAGETAAELRTQGRTVPLVDILIAAAAATRATLWTRDRHFERVAELIDQLELRLLDD